MNSGSRIFLAAVPATNTMISTPFPGNVNKDAKLAAPPKDDQLHTSSSMAMNASN
jgi:hypothetical protein